MQSGLDVWMLMTDTNAALDEITKAAERYAPESEADRLIDRGDKVKPATDSSRDKNRLRACPAAYANPDNTSPPQCPTVFQTVCADEDRTSADVQWAVMTLLAINVQFRERIAAASPGPAASLVREMPQRFERYLLGTKTTETMTAYEAVCDFTNRVQLVYAGIKVHTPT